jgi:hypothetical protein
MLHEAGAATRTVGWFRPLTEVMPSDSRPDSLLLQTPSTTAPSSSSGNICTPAVSINAAFLAGSLYEPDDLPGLAHLTARVIDRGTTRRSAEVIAGELDERGVSLRIATTRHVMTFSSTCLAEDFADVLDIIVDVARCPTFPEVELSKRRAESITAIRQDDDNPAVQAVETFRRCPTGVASIRPPREDPVDSLELITRDAVWRSIHATSGPPFSRWSLLVMLRLSRPSILPLGGSRVGAVPRNAPSLFRPRTWAPDDACEKSAWRENRRQTSRTGSPPSAGWILATTHTG